MQRLLLLVLLMGVALMGCPLSADEDWCREFLTDCDADNDGIIDVAASAASATQANHAKSFRADGCPADFLNQGTDGSGDNYLQFEANCNGLSPDIRSTRESADVFFVLKNGGLCFSTDDDVKSGNRRCISWDGACIFGDTDGDGVNDPGESCLW